MKKTHLAAAIASVLAAPAIHAQQAGTNALPAVQVQGKASRTTTLDSVNATGSRLGLTVRETPASLELIDRETLDQRGVRTLDDALNGAAGVTVGGAPGSPGVSSTRGFSGGYITYLFDGTRISVPTMSTRPQDSWNYERVEVLKGPASVLYGEGGIGGAVNFVPRRADRSKPGSEALLAYGSHGSLRAAAGTGGAFGDSGAYRVDFSHQQTDGWREQSAQRMDQLTSAVSLRPSAALALEFSADWTRDDLDADYGIPLVSAAFAKEPTSVVSDAAGRVIDRRMLKTSYNVRDGVMDSDSLWLRARQTWDFAPGWQLRNELSHYSADRLWRNSESYSFVSPDRINRTMGLVSHDHQVWGDRLDISHQGQLFGQPNRFVIGAEVTQTDFGSQRRFSDGSALTDAAFQVSALSPDTGLYVDNAIYFTGAGNRTDVTSDVRTTAVFLEDALKITRAWTAVIGARSERIKLTRTVNDLNATTHPYTAFGARYRPNSLRIGAVYDWSPVTTLFAQAVDAAAPVGSANLLLQSSANGAFPLTRGTQYEVGIKQGFNNVEWTASVYQIEQSNVLSRDPSNPALTVNNGKVSSRGAELSAAWRATPQLTLSGNAALVDAQFDTLVEAGGVSRVGKRPPLVPRQTARLWVAYRLDSLPVTLGAAWTRTGAMFTDNANSIRINGWSRLDLHASWQLKSTRLSLRIRNATDKLYATWSSANTSQFMLGAPRTVELSAKFDF
ncbi:TonB-dependent siderophore receptor [Roseateles asaccharophilus]|uniref:Iron complex outermembrane receptor protein n=1 Tax=Roseateles asaccharophilus TaxID=582607 RepID=A0ABU2A3S4_9BURK|nr:TonB-dependent siderophore receptor [Roseateles asaccharophilus]MDR7331829.1 iron complex outermembrane receptor protein [Roseateles asaccharophilus]